MMCVLTLAAAAEAASRSAATAAVAVHLINIVALGTMKYHSVIYGRAEIKRIRGRGKGGGKMRVIEAREWGNSRGNHSKERWFHQIMWGLQRERLPFWEIGAVGARAVRARRLGRNFYHTPAGQLRTTRFGYLTVYRVILILVGGTREGACPAMKGNYRIYTSHAVALTSRYAAGECLKRAMSKVCVDATNTSQKYSRDTISNPVHGPVIVTATRIHRIDINAVVFVYAIIDVDGMTTIQRPTSTA
ncbi:hypothetical protein EVAR_75607_1 [Eumeta japonica]|uniref:Uncharacterized protein n=1 Tax=Eumeta variegata TaxID=151549 RepID=A0A4C1TZY7_EUMVA|nr:hypothetical protein EVAR_75607_1 [Eumeta japonica]